MGTDERSSPGDQDLLVLPIHADASFPFGTALRFGGPAPSTRTSQTTWTSGEQIPQQSKITSGPDLSSSSGRSRKAGQGIAITAAVQPLTPYQAVIAAAKHPVVRTQIAVEREPEPGARTFEAQLEDGRWLHISERRIKGGGFVSVGTDITPLKKHEERLMESERELMATVADLRRSRQALEQQAQQLSTSTYRDLRASLPRL